MDLQLVMLVLLFVAVVMLGILVRGRNSEDTSNGEEELKGLRDMLAKQEGRLAQMSEDHRKSQGELSKAVQDRLDNVGTRMGQSLEDAATKNAKSMGELHTRLKVIDDAQENLKALSGDIMGLQDILSNKQTRGEFGEQQLNDLVANMLPPNAYSLQTTLSNGKRADCLLILPNPPGPIVVDSKFPLESFRELMAAEDKAAREIIARKFRADVKVHIDAISSKYIIPGETAESALMFLPSEAVYAELFANFPEVVEAGFKARVWIVSPTTMMATLNTIRAVLKDVKMREQAGIIQKHVGVLLADVVRLDKRVDNLGRHFSQAEKDIDEIQKSTSKIVRHTEKIEAIEMEEPAAEEALPPSSPRLVGDAD